MKKTAIILVNYKNYAKKFLFDCRDSLRAQTYPKDLIRVYIIDNNSTSETEKYLKEIYPEAFIIPRFDGNYTAANNTGIKQGIKDGCKLFVIVNMDTVMTTGWLEELVSAVTFDDNIGIAQSKILLYNSGKINTLGNIIHFLGLGFTSAYHEDDRDIQGLPEILGYASGCSFIIKKEVLEKIGFYNEDYYMYHDDLEIGLKVRLAGYKIILAPKSIIYHKYEFSRSIKMIYYMERNRLITIFSFYELRTLILIFLPLLIMEIGIIFYSIINGWWREKLKVLTYFLFLKNWRKIIEARHFIKKIRKISDKKIIATMSGKIIFQEIENPILKYLVNPFLNFYWQLVKNFVK